MKLELQIIAEIQQRNHNGYKHYLCITLTKQHKLKEVRVYVVVAAKTCQQYTIQYNTMTFNITNIQCA